MGTTWSQFFPSPPTLTEANLPSQREKVFIVTGGASGIGFEICSILYRAGAKVHIAGRSETKASAAIASIKSSAKSAPVQNAVGELRFLLVSLDDLTTIKPATDSFLASETRLDAIFNNAGVSNPPKGSTGVQGHELQMATNCLGPYLFTQLLLPILVRTARSGDGTRVIWTSSIATDMGSPKGGIPPHYLVNPAADQQLNYSLSKTGNWFLADALAKQAGGDGVLSVTINPGNLRSDLTRHLPRWIPALAAPLLHHPKFGAYTALWAALSTELTIDDGGAYIVPWGRKHSNPREDILVAMKSTEHGGTGEAAVFMDFCREQIAAHS